MSFINVQNLTFGYEGSLEKVFDEVSFHMEIAPWGVCVPRDDYEKSGV